MNWKVMIFNPSSMSIKKKKIDVQQKIGTFLRRFFIFDVLDRFFIINFFFFCYYYATSDTSLNQISFFLNL